MNSTSGKNDFVLYDFDAAFEEYLKRWFDDNRGKYATYDEMEDQVPEVYQAFLDSPQPFIDGRKPGEFFDRYDDADQLVQWMLRYEEEGVSVPDMLLNRISELGDAAARSLIKVLCETTRPASVRMSAITLLRELESALPYPMYVEWAAAWDGQDEMTENAIESLEAAETDLTEQIMPHLKNATPVGKAALLSILSHRPCEKPVIDMAIALFEEHPELRAQLASVLARFEDDSVLPALMKAASSDETGYLVYIELRSAIEALGGEAPRRRFDEDDPEYASMRSLEEKLIRGE